MRLKNAVEDRRYSESINPCEIANIPERTTLSKATQLEIGGFKQRSPRDTGTR